MKECISILDPTVVRSFFTTLGILIAPIALIAIKNIICTVFNNLSGKWYRKAYAIARTAENSDRERTQKENEAIKDCKSKGERYDKVSNWIHWNLEIDNCWNNPIQILYTIFWVVGGFIMTFVAFVWLVMGFGETCEQHSILVSKERDHANISQILEDPEELTIKQVQELNEFFRIEATNRKVLYAIKPEVIEDYKERLYIDVNPIRAKVVKKYSVPEIIDSIVKNDK